MLSALFLVNGFLWFKWMHNFEGVSDTILEQENGWYQHDVAFIRARVILLLSTAISLIVTFATKPVDNDKLLSFYKKIRPKGWWVSIATQVPELVDTSSSRDSWLGFVFGVLFLNSILFTVGHVVLGGYTIALVLMLVGAITGWLILKMVETAKTQETQ